MVALKGAEFLLRRTALPVNEIIFVSIYYLLKERQRQWIIEILMYFELIYQRLQVGRSRSTCRPYVIPLEKEKKVNFMMIIKYINLRNLRVAALHLPTCCQESCQIRLL